MLKFVVKEQMNSYLRLSMFKIVSPTKALTNFLLLL